MNAGQMAGTKPAEAGHFLAVSGQNTGTKSADRDNGTVPGQGGVGGDSSSTDRERKTLLARDPLSRDKTGTNSGTTTGDAGQGQVSAGAPTSPIPRVRGIELKCPGAKSVLHTGVMRMCPTSCAHWEWEGEGMEPQMQRVDGVWQCPNRVPRWPEQETDAC